MRPKTSSGCGDERVGELCEHRIPRFWFDESTRVHYLKDRQANTELARIGRELKRLKAQIAALEKRKSKLMADRRR